MADKCDFATMILPCLGKGNTAHNVAGTYCRGRVRSYK